MTHQHDAAGSGNALQALMPLTKHRSGPRSLTAQRRRPGRAGRLCNCARQHLHTDERDGVMATHPRHCFADLKLRQFGWAPRRSTQGPKCYLAGVMRQCSQHETWDAARLKSASKSPSGWKQSHCMQKRSRSSPCRTDPTCMWNSQTRTLCWCERCSCAWHPSTCARASCHCLRERLMAFGMSFAVDKLCVTPTSSHSPESAADTGVFSKRNALSIVMQCTLNHVAEHACVVH